ncbi:anti-lipopolysaccharide factor-like [Macrobrachium nipponense]|uniref:anti-lipopolysaccharide factor-like n=1 Tax=Macrobrachium nipponense TaxID=159736 RepID=UPI0030C87A64
MALIRYNSDPKIGMLSALLTFSILLLLTEKAETKPLDLLSLVTGVVPKIVNGVYDEGDIDLFGKPCQYKRIPYIKRLELHYRAEIRCLGWTPIVGEARDHRNPTHAEQAAIKDFVRQAVAQALVTEEQAKPWLTD